MRRRPNVVWWRRASDERGFTILELLVSTLVGLTVLGGLTGAVISQGRSMATQRGLADAQAMGRGTNEILMQDLRMAGYGMLGVSPDDDLPPIEVTSVGGVTTITLRGAYSNTQSQVAGTTPAGATSIVVTPPAEGAFLVNELVLIDSGLSSEVKTITAVSPSGGTITLGLSSALAHQYPLGPNVIQLEEIDYDFDGGSLRRDDQMLADNVHDFDLQYIDQADQTTSTPGESLRAVLIDVVTKQSSKLPDSPDTTATMKTEVNVRNLAFRFSLG